MRILFLGDVVGIAGCSKIMNNLLNQIKVHKINFVIVNGENAAEAGVGLTKEICEDFYFAEIWIHHRYIGACLCIDGNVVFVDSKRSGKFKFCSQLPWRG